MEATAENMREVLKTVAMQEVSGASEHGLSHASRIGRVQVNSWQAEILRHSPEIKIANDSAELRTLMAQREGYVIFLPQAAAVSSDIIDRICRESPFDKLIIWENA